MNGLKSKTYEAIIYRIVKRCSTLMLLLALTAFGAGQTNAQTVNKDRYITLTVESGVDIKLQMGAFAEGTPIEIEAGTNVIRDTLGTSKTSLQVNSTDNTIKVYGDLKTFWCHGNGEKITALDASQNTELGDLVCMDNQLTELDVRQNTALIQLYCSQNQLTSLDVSNNTTLQYLFCVNNHLTSLNLGDNTSLSILDCPGNQLTSLDLTANTGLTQMDCSNNQLTSLDVSTNTNLQWLICSNNHLTSLDVTANTSLTDFYCVGNKAIVGFPLDLSSLSGFDLSKASEWQGGTLDGTTLKLNEGAIQVTYTYNCGNDHTAQFALVQNSTEELEISETNFPDAIFRQYVKDNFDKNNDDKFTIDELIDVTSIVVDKTNDTPEDQKIADLTGIEHFLWLTEISAIDNNLTSLDFSKNTALTFLNCSSNPLTSLNVTQNTELEVLWLYNTKLTTLDVSQNAKLLRLQCSKNQLTSLDVFANTALTEFHCAGNMVFVDFPVTLTDLPGNFDVSKASEWKGGTLDGTTLNLDEGAVQVTYTYDCGNGHTAQFALVQNSTEELDINATNFPDAIFRQYVSENFDKNNNGKLSLEERIEVRSINVEKTEDTPDEQKIADLTGVEHFQWLTFLNCGYNKLTALDVSKNTELRSLYCYYNNIASLDVTHNTQVGDFGCSGNKLTTLDVSQNTKLNWFNCGGNLLTELDLSANTALQTLYCYDNQFTSLDVTANTALQLLDCSYNHLTELNVNANTALQKLDCQDNLLTSLDLSQNTALWELYCNNNQLTELNLSANTALQILNCGNNYLTSLDVSQTALTNLWADGNSFEVDINPLDVTTLPGAFDIKRASNWTNASASGNILTISGSPVTYQYDCGKDKVVTFTLTADQLDCTLTFDANGGTGTIPNTLEGNKVHMRKNTVYTLPECTFTAPVNMQFDRWDCGNPGDAITVDKDVTVKALWKHIPVTITFDANGGTGEMAPVTVNKGSEYALPECKFTAPTGKEFDKWKVNNKKYNPGETITVDKDLTVTAVWKEATAVDVDRSAQLTLYPNPASNVLYINGVDLKTISLYDMLGRLVTVRSADSANATVLNVNSYQTGVYLVRIELTNGQFVTRKILIN